MKKCVLLFVMMALFVPPALAGSTVSVTVKTPLGDVQGLSDGEVAVFKGIPYAKPPVGELAYAPTQPVEKWDGVLDATKFGPSASQMRLRIFSPERSEPVISLRSLILSWMPRFSISSASSSA